ncbi:MAG: ABC transporter substrate-binding protein, partial [Deferrisomatales bacterium]
MPSLVAGLALAGAAQAAETFKLALSLAITGPTSDAGVPYSMGADDYVKYVNDNKVLGDNKVVIDIR